MDTKKLRQKILDLAIHGKLVPQDPNDEPASVLLERIKAEKEQLIKEGKIKRQKKSASSDTSHYGNIPDEWCEAPMSELFILNPKSKLADESLCGFIPMSLVEDGFSGRHYFETRNWGQVKKGFSQFQNGDIGIAKISPCFENLKSVIFENLPNGNGAGTTELTILRSLGVYSKFYLYLFKSGWYISEGTKYFKGVVGQQRVNKEIFTDLIVPLPPLNEQKRIVEEIDRYFALVDVLEQNEYDLKDAVQKAKSKILDLALSGRLTSDTSHYEKKEWESARISDICTTINGLWTGKKEPFVKVGVIRNANFTKDFNLDYSKIALIDVEAASFSKRSLMTGDLIVEKSGGSDKYPVGRAVLYEGPNSQYSFSNFTMVLRLKESNVINPKYLYYFLMNRYLQGIMQTMQTQTTGLHNLILDKFMSQTVALPPIEEQAHIVESISRYFTILDSISSSC